MKAVIWVSTVLYILISLAVIGIVIAAVQPRIEAARDKAVVEQTIIMLNELDSVITRTDGMASGTKLSSQFKISKGIMMINATNDKIVWQYNGNYQFSEPGTAINIGKIQAKTTKGKSTEGFDITLTLDYYGKVNITSKVRWLQPSEIPYKLFIENKGSSNKINQLDITVS